MVTGTIFFLVKISGMRKIFGSACLFFVLVDCFLPFYLEIDCPKYYASMI